MIIKNLAWNTHLVAMLAKDVVLLLLGAEERVELDEAVKVDDRAWGEDEDLWGGEDGDAGGERQQETLKHRQDVLSAHYVNLV